MATGEILIKVNDISLFDEIKEAISRVRGIVSVSLTKKDTNIVIDVLAQRQDFYTKDIFLW